MVRDTVWATAVEPHAGLIAASTLATARIGSSASKDDAATLPLAATRPQQIVPLARAAPEDKDAGVRGPRCWDGGD